MSKLEPTAADLMMTVSSPHLLEHCGNIYSPSPAERRLVQCFPRSKEGAMCTEVVLTFPGLFFALTDSCGESSEEALAVWGSQRLGWEQSHRCAMC